MRQLAQKAIDLIARPYVRREFPGWGKVLSLTAGHQRDWLWVDAPRRVITGKIHHYQMHLDMKWWADRSTYFLGRWHNLETQLILRDLVQPGSTVIDVGSNRGMFALTASCIVGPKGRIICFDPNPQCASTLKWEIAENGIENITVRTLALGDAKAERTLTVPWQNSGSGTLNAAALKRSVPTYDVISYIVVGDEELADVSPDFIKINVEGFEYSALSGLIETIKRSRPIIIHEVISALLKANGATFANIAKMMRAIDYRGFRIGLRKETGQYDWSLSEIKDDPEFDAMWIPRERVSEINGHFS